MNFPEIIQKINSDTHLKKTADLIHDVLMLFVSCDYSEVGAQTFLKYASFEAIHKRINAESFILGAFWGTRIVGVLEMKNDAHLSLLFVDANWQGKGIATRLLGRAQAIVMKGKKKVTFTVNSSRIAVPFYEKCGFVPHSEEQERNGLRFIPMSFEQWR